MIAELESEGKEIEFDEFLRAITDKLGDKETKNGILLSLILFRYNENF